MTNKYYKQGHSDGRTGSPGSPDPRQPHEPEEIARAVAFLASEENSFLTGSNLVINGGQYLL